MEHSNGLPEGFTHLKDPRILLSMDYATSNNFLGRPVAGYLSPVCILTQKAANALINVQDSLDQLAKNLHLKIFDAYRPATAVSDFVQWSKDPLQQTTKSKYYPTLDKRDLFKLGYIGEPSTHSRGSTVDLTIVVQSNDDRKKYTELEMGSFFDFFNETSNTDSPNVSEDAKQNRFFLKTLMEKHGFKNFPMEWWHFTLENEPFPTTTFDFVVA